MATISDANKTEFQKGDKLFFDCNALMYIFYTYGNYSDEIIDAYKKLFYDAIDKECMIFIPSMEVSEFVNTYCRQEFGRYKRTLQNEDRRNFSYKYDYRKTDDYKETIQEIKTILNRQIFSICHKLDDDFSKINLSGIFENEETFDFNDRYYCKLAQAYDLKIITNDSDFFLSEDNIEVITSNKKLLAKSREDG